MNDALPVVADPKRQALANDYERALVGLHETQRRYVEALLESGDVKAALAEAGLTARDAPRRMRTNPRVQAAIAAGRALREYGPAMDRSDVEAMLEQALRLRVEEFFAKNEAGVPLDAIAWEALPTAAHLRVKKLTATTDRTALGARAKLVRLTAEFWNPVELVSKLAQLRGWAQAEAPLVNIDLAGEWQKLHAAPDGTLTAPTMSLDELADALCSDHELDEFVRLKDPRAQLAYLRQRATELRRVREERDRAS